MSEEKQNFALNEVDSEEVDRILHDPELMEKILKDKKLEDNAGLKTTRINKEAISVIITIFSIIVVGVFLLSPFIQFIERVIVEGTDESWTMETDRNYDILRVLDLYSSMIKNIHVVVHFITTILYGFCVVRIITGWKEIRKKLVSYLSRLIPLFIFILFDLSIVLVTVIRGANEYDLIGHYYMNESIYSYILYPIAYFFCAMLLDKEKIKRILLYTLVFTALPMHILALLNEWNIIPIRYFIKNGVTLVFHQFNHYGYYIMITLLTSAFLFVYEKKRWLKIIDLISVCVCTMILIVNDTFGAYLATLSTLILFMVFLFATTKRKKTKVDSSKNTESVEGVSENVIQEGAAKHKRKISISDMRHKIVTPGSRYSIVFILALFLLITLAMSFRYSNVISSAIRTAGDVGKVIVNDESAGKAGTGRWQLWVGTAKGIVEKPLTGWGVEGLLNTKKVGTPHNELLQYAAFFGIPTCLLYVAAVLLILWRVLRNQKRMSRTTMICFFVSLGYLTSSLFGVAIYYTTPFVYIFLGLAYAEYLRVGPEPKCKKTPRLQDAIERVD